MSNPKELQIGEIITRPQFKDAIHVAIFPALADDRIYAGFPVKLNKYGNAVRATPTDAIGVADPFLGVRGKNDDELARVESGERFWIFLKPGSVVNLRHEWAHPAIDAEFHRPPQSPPDESVLWLRNYAKQVNTYLDADVAYETLMTDIRNRALTYRGRDCHGYEDLIEPDLLFHHASIVLGEKVSADQFQYFSCSC